MPMNLIDLVNYEERIRKMLDVNEGPGNFDETIALFDSSPGLTCIAVTLMADNATSTLSMSDKMFSTFILGWLLANKFRDGDKELMDVIASAPSPEKFTTYVKVSLQQLSEANKNEKRIFKI